MQPTDTTTTTQPAPEPFTAPTCATCRKPLDVEIGVLCSECGKEWDASGTQSDKGDLQ